LKTARLNRLPEAWLRALRQQRRRLGWSQAELGARIGLGQVHVSAIERGKVSPRVDTLLDIARALDLDLVLTPRALVPAIQALEREHEHRESIDANAPLYGTGEDEDATPGAAASELA
jgi:transcriptional regulator with XRE-family HTH domain